MFPLDIPQAVLDSNTVEEWAEAYKVAQLAKYRRDVHLVLIQPSRRLALFEDVS